MVRNLAAVPPIGWIVRVARRKAKDIALRSDADAIDLGEVTDDLIYFPVISPPQASRPVDD
jgi:hypothetical protein